MGSSIALTSVLAGGLLSLSVASGVLWAANVNVAGILAGDVNVNSRGGLAYDLPLKLAPGYNGLNPELSLSYNSRNNQTGILGVGWQLNGLSAIYRCGKSLQLDGEVGPVEYDDGDRLCLDGNRLIASTGSSDGQYWSSGARYHSYEESWIEILPSAHTCVGEVCYFQATRSDGTSLFYGLDNTNARSGEPVSGLYGRWHLNRIQDRNGNQINISYHKVNRISYPNQITYNNGFTIQFRYHTNGASVYDQQTVWATNNTNALQGTSTMLLDRIEVWKDLSIFKVYELSYITSDNSKRSLLNRIQECDRVDNGKCLEPVDIDWNQYDWHASNSDGAKFIRKFPSQVIGGQDIYQHQLKGVHGHPNESGAQIYPGDFDGDGRTDFIKMEMGGWAGDSSGSFCVYYGKSATKTNGEFDRICPNASYNAGANSYAYQSVLRGVHNSGGDGVNIIPGDFNADGRMDFIRQEVGGWAGDTTNSFNVFLSKGTRDGEFEVITPNNAGEQSKLRGAHGSEGNGVTLITGDFNGDGKTDLAAQQHGDWADTDGGDHGQDFVIYFSNFVGQAGDFDDYAPTGNGMANSSSLFHGGTDGGNSGAYIIPGDFNGDGRTDFIRQEWGPWAENEDKNFEVYFSLGDGEFRREYSGNGSNFQRFFRGRHGSNQNGVNIITGDFNGDRKTDFIAQRFNKWSLAQYTSDDSWIFRVCISKGNGDFDCRIPDVGQGAGVNLERMAGLERKQDFWRHAFNNPKIGTGILTGDFNGDGKTDFIRQEGWKLGQNNVDTFEVHLSRGNGVNWDRFTPPGANYQDHLRAAHYDTGCNTSLLNECHPGANIIPGDYDGDGRLDFLKQEFGKWATGNDSNTFAVYLNPGSLGPIGHPTGTAVAQPADTIMQIAQGKKEIAIKYLEMTGLNPSGGVLAAYGNGVNNSCSGASCFRQTPDGPFWLVDTVIEKPFDSGLSSRYSNYQYGTPVSGNQGGFLGFRQIQVTQPQKDLRVLTTYEFHAKGAFRAGRANWTHTYRHSTNTEIKRNMLGWALNTGRLSTGGNSTYWMRLYAEHSFDFAYSDGSANAAFKRETNYTHNLTNGNVTKVEEKYPGASTVYTCTDYYPENTGLWVLNEIERVRVGDTADCSSPLKKTEFTYDNKGNILTEKEFYSSSGYLTTGYSNFTSGGLPQTVSLPSGLVRTVGYGSNGHVISVAEGSLTTTFANDPEWGQWHTKTDPNGRVFNRSFDTFGRLHTISAPDNGATPNSFHRKTITYYWSGGTNLVQRTKTKTHWSGNERTEDLYTNAWGNMIQKLVSAPGQKTIKTVYGYNERDQKTYESLPYFWNTPADRRDTLYTYGDNYFRLTAVAVGPNSSSTGNLSATSLTYGTNGACPTGNQRVTRSQGNRTKTGCKDIQGRTTLTENQTSDGTKTQTWQYDALGQVTQSSDTLSTTTTTYDMMGRKTSIDNDQRGKQVLAYQSSWGGMLRTISYFDTDNDRIGRWRVDNIDSRKRPTSIGRIVYESDGVTVASSRRTLLSYDAAGDCSSFANAAGRLCKTRVQRKIGSGAYTALLTRVHAYDNSGNLKMLRTRLEEPGHDYTMSYEYGPEGNRTKVKYPAGREANYTYDNMGRISQVQEAGTGSTVYATYADYNPTGQAGEVYVNNNNAKETRSYDDYHRLSNIKIEKVGVAVHMDQALSYTGFGEINTVSGTLVGNSISFDYNYNQWGFITRAESTGYQNYGTLTFDYDTSARLSQKDGKDYTYDDAGNRKYRVVSRSGADNLTLSYNKAGSVVSRSQNGTTNNYEYNYNQQLLKVKQGGATQAEFEYDSAGNRWMKKDANGRIHYYITPEMDVQNFNGSWIPAHYIMGPEGRIAVMSGSGTGKDIVFQQHAKHTMLAELQNLQSVSGIANWSYHTAAMFVLHPAVPNAANGLLILLTLLALAAFGWFFLQSAHSRSALGGLRAQLALVFLGWELISHERALAFSRTHGTSFMRRHRRLSLALPLALMGLLSFHCAQNDEQMNAAGLNPGMIGLDGNALNGLPNPNQGRYFHTNKVGNVHLVTDKFSNAITTPIYRPFGEIHYVGAHNDTRYKFQGKELDHTTELYYFGARYYDPDLGRFIQADSLAVGGNVPHASNMDRYAAFGNNPLSFIDPSGNLGILVTGLIIWAISTIVSFSIAAISAAIYAKRHGGSVNWGQLAKEEAIGAAISLAFVGLGAGVGAGRAITYSAKRAFMSNLNRLGQSAFRKAVGRAGAYLGGTAIAFAEASVSGTFARMATKGESFTAGEVFKGAAIGVAFGQAIGLGTSGIKGYYKAKYDVDLNPDFSTSFDLPLAQRRQLDSQLYAFFGGLNSKDAKYKMARILTQSSEGSALFRSSGYLRNMSSHSAFRVAMGKNSMLDSWTGFARSTAYGAVVDLAKGPFNEKILYGNHCDDCN
ncbi:MAG: FG-GAP-like repeat-containing protein [bacterium]|nr:FG-GAP-like repeat-containing protein [bacterium]